MKQKHVIVDCDPGIDDMLSLMMLFFDKKVSVDLLCAGAGNSGLEICSRNLLDIAAFFGQKIPIVLGEPKPMKAKLQTAVSAQGSNGLGGYVLPKSKQKALKNYEKEYTKVLLKNGIKGTTIVVIEPATTVACLLLKKPELKEYINEIVFMGGTIEGVNNPGEIYNEFNVKNDPDALNVLLNSGIKVTICPMELGHYTYLTLEEIDQIAKTGFVGLTLTKIFLGYKDGHVQTGVPVHDPTAVAYFLDNKICKYKYVKSSFEEFENKPPQIVYYFNNEPTNLKLLLKIDNKKFKKMFFKLLKIAEKNKKS